MVVTDAILPISLSLAGSLYFSSEIQTRQKSIERAQLSIQLK